MDAPLSAMISWEGQQDIQAAPEGHFGATKQETDPYLLLQVKRNLSDELQPKKSGSQKALAVKISNIFRGAGRQDAS